MSPRELAMDQDGSDADALRALVEQAVVGIAQLDLQGRIVLVNPRFAEIAGRSAGALVDVLYHELVHPDDASGARLAFEKIVAGQGSLTTEKRFVRSDGSYAWIDSIESLVTDAHGSPRSVVAIIEDASKRRKELDDLQRSKREVEGFFESAYLGLMRIDPEGMIVWTSNPESDLLGHGAKEYVGRSMSDLHVDRFAFEDVMNRLNGGASVVNYEVRLRHRDGSLRHVLLNASGHRVGERLVHAHVLFRDITAKKHAEDAQRRSDEQLRLIANAIPALVSYITPDFRYQFANKTYEDWFSRPIRDIVGARVADVIGEEAFETIRPHLTSAMAGRRVRFESPIRYRDAGARHIAAEYIPQLAEDGTTVLGVVALVNDVSERRRADEAQARLASIVESSNDAVIGTTLEGVIASWNEGAERIFKRKADVAVGRPIQQIFGSSHSEILEHRLAEVRTGSNIRDFEFQFDRGDGFARFLSLSISPMRNASQGILGVSMIARDISERKRSEAELLAHRHRLEEMVAARTEALRQTHDQLRRSERLVSIGTLAAGIAHEINNPLNAILMSVQYALEFRDEVDIDKTLKAIGEEAQRGGRIVRGVLTFAREEHSAKTVGDLNQVIRRAVGITASYIGSSQVAVEFDLAEAPCNVAMNATEIEQVLVNLIKNAAESSSRKIYLVIRTIRMSSIVRMTVSDNGPGIPEDVLRRIFDPFFSTRRASAGTGLGLSITHGIVTEHNGTISVSSDVGKGTQFTIDLPLASRVDPGR